MSTEVWFRNPISWMDQVVKVGANRVVWHRGICIKRRIDPVAHARIYFGESIDWRVMVVGANGAQEYGPNSPDQLHPMAVYPVWHFGDPLADLEGLVLNNVAEDPLARRDPSLEREYWPIEGQGHRVVIVNWPSLGPGAAALTSRRFLTLLGEMQQDHPACKLHLFECYSFRTAFGFGVGSVDLDPLPEAGHKRVFLPNGHGVEISKLAKVRQWVHLTGMSVSDLNEKTGRVEFNLRSALWAGENYGKNLKFKTSGDFITDYQSAEVTPIETKLPVSRWAPMQAGDKVACDSCSLQYSCKYSRAGAVCSLPESETVALAKFFKSRDAETIMDGLAEVLAMQSIRATKAVEWEEEAGELSKETTAVLAAIFDGGVKLAKLRNPQLAAGPKIAVQINSGSGSTAVVAANPKALMAAVVKELEDRGVPREHITPEVVMKMIEGAKPEEFIEAEVVDESA